MDSSYKNTTSEIRGNGIRALTLKEFLCDHEGNRGTHMLYTYINTHTQETPAIPTLTYYHIPYLDNPLSHRIQSARPITPPIHACTYTNTQVGDTQYLCHAEIAIYRFGKGVKYEVFVSGHASSHPHFSPIPHFYSFDMFFVDISL